MLPLLKKAKDLRQNQTDAEKKFWRLVRAKRFSGYKFKRQCVIGSYICDFACMNLRLVVEIDGGQHNENAADELRSKQLLNLGYRVIRFWNNDILTNIEGVAQNLSLTLSQRERELNTPPLPLGEGWGEG